MSSAQRPGRRVEPAMMTVGSWQYARVGKLVAEIDPFQKLDEMENSKVILPDNEKIQSMAWPRAAACWLRATGICSPSSGEIAGNAVPQEFQRSHDQQSVAGPQRRQ